MTQEKLKEASEISFDIEEFKKCIEILKYNDSSFVVHGSYPYDRKQHISKKYNIVFIETIKNLIKDLEIKFNEL